jgi:hypothetical protein
MAAPDGTAVKHLRPVLIGFVLGAAVMCGVFAFSAHQTPSPPELRPPTAIQVTLYPWPGVGGIDGEPVDIPPEKLDRAFRLLTPERYFEGGVHEFITRIVAEAVIIHADGTATPVLVRDHGPNPAVVSIDGRTYFYARSDPDVHAGAIQLIRLVNEVAHAKKAWQNIRK